MKRRVRGSILITAILVVGLVSTLMVVGTEYFLRFAGEAQSLEHRLIARHCAQSGLAYAESTGETTSKLSPMGSGAYQIEAIRRSGSYITIRSQGESFRGEHPAANCVLIMEYRRSGNRLIPVGRLLDPSHVGDGSHE